MRIVLTGGGTAGHVTPHLALIPPLQREGWDIHYIGSETGIERELIDSMNREPVSQSIDRILEQIHKYAKADKQG